VEGKILHPLSPQVELAMVLHFSFFKEEKEKVSICIASDAS
jgi:hypothetical protein